MKAQRLPYVRPMLEVSKAKIDGYIQEYHLPFVEDASNQDTAYRRNHIRHRLLPLLEQEYNPEIVTALSRMAELLQEEEAFLEEQVPQVPRAQQALRDRPEARELQESQARSRPRAPPRAPSGCGSGR